MPKNSRYAALLTFFNLECTCGYHYSRANKRIIVVTCDVDRERVGKATDSPKRLHRSNGGRRECSHIYFWIL